MNIFKRFFNWLFGTKVKPIAKLPPLPTFSDKVGKKLPTKKEWIRKINGANKIYNMYLVKSKAFAQQAANAYYAKGRKGLRQFIQNNG
jgi:hypothetical protein